MFRLTLKTLSKANDESEYILKRLKAHVHPKGSIVKDNILIGRQIFSLSFFTVVIAIHLHFSHANKASEDDYHKRKINK